MPTIVRKSGVALMEPRRDILHAVSWQVRSTIWSPPTDVYETDKAYIVRVEVAGMREEDFEVAVENHTLHISGVRSDAPNGAHITRWKYASENLRPPSVCPAPSTLKTRAPNTRTDS